MYASWDYMIPFKEGLNEIKIHNKVSSPVPATSVTLYN